MSNRFYVKFPVQLKVNHKCSVGHEPWLHEGIFNLRKPTRKLSIAMHICSRRNLKILCKRFITPSLLLVELSKVAALYSFLLDNLVLKRGSKDNVTRSLFTQTWLLRAIPRPRSLEWRRMCVLRVCQVVLLWELTLYHEFGGCE